MWEIANCGEGEWVEVMASRSTSLSSTVASIERRQEADVHVSEWMRLGACTSGGTQRGAQRVSDVDLQRRFPHRRRKRWLNGFTLDPLQHPYQRFSIQLLVIDNSQHHKSKVVNSFQLHFLYPKTSPWKRALIMSIREWPSQSVRRYGMEVSRG